MCIHMCIHICTCSYLTEERRHSLLPLEAPPRGADAFASLTCDHRCCVAQVVYWNKVQHLMFLLLISVVYVHINNIFVFLFNLFINYFTSEGLVRVLKSHRVIGRIETCHLFLKLRIALRRSGSPQSRTLLGSRLARWPWMPNHT